MPARLSPTPIPTSAELARLCHERAHVGGGTRRASVSLPPYPASTPIELAGERVELHPDRALYWPVRRTLFVADVHLGKEHVFGRHGIPIPAGISENGLARLAHLVLGTRAERLVVLGDLMHDTPAASESWPGALTGFLDAHASLAVEICAGNHDRDDARSKLDSRLAWLGEPHLDGPFVYRHHPADDPRGHVLCGHVHPVCRIGGRRGFRLPAFWCRPGHLVLPAFGEFTGGHAIEVEDGDRVWVAGPERVVRAMVGVTR